MRLPIRTTIRRGGGSNGRRYWTDLCRQVFVVSMIVSFVALMYYYQYVHTQILFANNAIVADGIDLPSPRPPTKDGTTEKNDNVVLSSSLLDTSLAESILSQPIRLEKCKIHKPSHLQVASSLSSYVGSDSTVGGGSRGNTPPGRGAYGGTIVTAYFRVKSKYDPGNYDRWMENILSIQDPMIIFTQSDMVELIRTMRERAQQINNTIVIEMNVHDLPIVQLAGRTKYKNSTMFWDDQLINKDVEKKRHQSYKVFWIWLSKTWWVVQAIQQFNYFHTDFFMWSDIGCFRNKAYNGKQILQYPDMVPDGTILWEAHHPIHVPPNSPIFMDKFTKSSTGETYFYHSGSQAAGRAHVWIQYHRRFARTIDDFLDMDYFIGEDQCVLQSACLQAPSLCTYVPFNQVNDNHYFGLRYVLHNGPNSAKNTKSGQYEFWRPPGWNML